MARLVPGVTRARTEVSAHRTRRSDAPRQRHAAPPASSTPTPRDGPRGRRRRARRCRARGSPGPGGDADRRGAVVRRRRVGRRCGRPAPPAPAPPGGGDRAKLDLRNTWQVVAGSILVPVGIVIILVAWYGVGPHALRPAADPLPGERLVHRPRVHGARRALVLGPLALSDLRPGRPEPRGADEGVRADAPRRGRPPQPRPVPGHRAGADRMPDNGPGAVVGAGPGRRPTWPRPRGPCTTCRAARSWPTTATGLRALAPADVADMEPCRICLVRRPILSRAGHGAEADGPAPHGGL